MSETSKFAKEIVFRPAFDKRDPDPKKNYGIHGVEVSFALKGESGTIVFLLYTPWHLNSVDTSKWPEFMLGFTPAEIGYHRKVKEEEFERNNDYCHFVEGPCAYAGSGLHAREYFTILKEQGSDGLWKALEAYYYRKFPLESTVVLEGSDIKLPDDTTFEELMEMMLNIMRADEKPVSDDEIIIEDEE